ncbi:MAG TPA: CFI-box-CTERM domain-containing protein [Candidatus Bathyarchaeia archaeon]|nr:CFI-box-CTERM domain-containing protein [Candidatus Bathyarchaeia archaeon]
MDPTNNTFQEWTIPTPNANPYDLAITTIAGSTVLWGTEFASDTIFAFFPASGLFLEYLLPAYRTGPGYISVEPPSGEVRVWFTETTSNMNGEFIYNPKTENGTLYQDQFPALVGGGATGVYAGSNSVWFAGFSALVRWDRASQEYTMWPLPTHGSAIARFITLDQYGEPWYVQGVVDGGSSNNFVGVLRGNSTFQEWRIPSVGADPRMISLNPITQEPWIAEQSSQAGNGTIATLGTLTGGTLVPSLPTVAPSGGNATTLSPIVNSVPLSTYDVVPTTSSISSSQNGQFSGYGFGASLPRDAVVDSMGNIWVSEPGTNRIARFSVTPDFAIRASPPFISLTLGSSGDVDVTAASISSYMGQVSLAVTSFPHGVSVSSITPNSLTIMPDQTVSSQLTINIASNATVGTNIITLQGTSGNVTHMASLILAITNTTVLSSPKCLIATATYGSELSPEVRLLRDFRDYSLMKSKIGSSFLIVFNAWYYSFSPYVAQYIANHPVARTLMKEILYPLVGFLFLSSKIYAELSAYPDLATVISGLVACMLIGGFYFGLPLGLLSRRRRNWNSERWFIVLLGSAIATLLGQILASTFLLMISTSTMVITAMLTSATFTAATITKKIDSNSQQHTKKVARNSKVF